MYTKRKERKPGTHNHRVLYSLSFLTVGSGDSPVLLAAHRLKCGDVSNRTIKMQESFSSKVFSAIYKLRKVQINPLKYDKDVLSFLSWYLNFYSKQLLSLYEKYLWFLPEVKVLCKTSCETWIIPFFKASLFRCLEILAEKEFKVKKQRR